jgi:FAS-associated factor 2
LKFKQTYGEKGPPFFEGSYSQALNMAKQELKYLIVVLHSEDHDDTHQFCVETLTNEQFVNYISDQNMLIWGGDVKQSEAYKVSIMLGVTRYPFMALIALHDNLMKVAHRFDGITSTANIIETINRLVVRLDRSYELARQERASRDADRRIREQQDAAYEESLRQDREKAEKNRLEQELQSQKENKEKELLEELERKRRVL